MAKVTLHFKRSISEIIHGMPRVHTFSGDAGVTVGSHYVTVHCQDDVDYMYPTRSVVRIKLDNSGRGN